MFWELPPLEGGGCHNDVTNTVIMCFLNGSEVRALPPYELLSKVS